MSGRTRPVRLYLVRHGETEMSLQGRFSGNGSYPLTPFGLAQADAAAKRIREFLHGNAVSVEVVASPIVRARQTGEQIAQLLGVPLKLDEDLRELDFGEWEARTWDEVATGWPDVAASWEREPDHTVPPGGESRAQAIHRVQQTWSRVTVDADADVVVVVSHITALQALLCAALTAPVPAAKRLRMLLGSISAIDWEPEECDVLFVNDASHLRSEGLVSSADRE